LNDELQLQREINRAAQAAELFRNPIFEESFDFLKARYQEEWSATALKDGETRERLYYLAQAVDAVRSHLQSVMETGSMAEKQIKELRKKSFM
jgi:hypothetical protein